MLHFAASAKLALMELLRREGILLYFGETVVKLNAAAAFQLRVAKLQIRREFSCKVPRENLQKKLLGFFPTFCSCSDASDIKFSLPWARLHCECRKAKLWQRATSELAPTKFGNRFFLHQNFIRRASCPLFGKNGNFLGLQEIRFYGKEGAVFWACFFLSPTEGNQENFYKSCMHRSSNLWTQETAMPKAGWSF